MLWPGLSPIHHSTHNCNAGETHVLLYRTYIWLFIFFYVQSLHFNAESECRNKVESATELIPLINKSVLKLFGQLDDFQNPWSVWTVQLWVLAPELLFAAALWFPDKS